MLEAWVPIKERKKCGAEWSRDQSESISEESAVVFGPPPLSFPRARACVGKRCAQLAEQQMQKACLCTSRLVVTGALSSVTTNKTRMALQTSSVFPPLVQVRGRTRESGLQGGRGDHL